MLLSTESTAVPAPATGRSAGPRAVLARAAPPAVLLVLGLAQLGRGRALWYDEAYSRLAAGVPLTTLLSGIWHRMGLISYLNDVPPSFNGPFYVVLHLWVSVVGGSAVALRLPSLLGAVAAVAVLTELVRKLAGSGAALTCGLLLATGPLVVDETTQARPYGLALLALALCALWLHDPVSSGRHLVRIVLSAACASLLHWFTIPVLVGFAVLAWRRGRGTPQRGTAVWLLAALVPAGLLVAWSVAGGASGAPHPAPVGLLLPVLAVGGWSGESIALGIALTAAGAVGVCRGPARDLVLCWFAVPLLLITGLELVHASYYPRYLLFTLVGLVVAAALGVSSVGTPWASRSAAAVLVALSLTATVPVVAEGDREPVRQTIAYLDAHQRTGQPIVAADGRVALELATYSSLAPRIEEDVVRPPEAFTTQTASDTVWLVRVVLQQNSLPVVDAERRLAHAGWTRQSSELLVGASSDLRVERWTR